MAVVFLLVRVIISCLEFQVFAQGFGVTHFARQVIIIAGTIRELAVGQFGARSVGAEVAVMLQGVALVVRSVVIPRNVEVDVATRLLEYVCIVAVEAHSVVVIRAQSRTALCIHRLLAERFGSVVRHEATRQVAIVGGRFVIGG